MTSATKKRSIDDVDIEEFTQSIKRMAISQTHSDHSLPKEQTKQIAQKSKKSFKRRPSRQKGMGLKFKLEKYRIEEKISALLKFIRNNPDAPYLSSVTSVRGNTSLSTLAPPKQQKVSIKHEQPSVITNRTKAVPETGKTPSVSPAGSEQSARKQGSRKRQRKDNTDNGSKRARIQDASLVDSLIAQFAKLSLG